MKWERDVLDTLRAIEREIIKVVLLLDRPTIILTFGGNVTPIPPANPQLAVGQQVVVNISTSTGAQLDSGSVTAETTDAGTDCTVTVDPSGTFLTIVANAADQGDTLTVNGTVNGVACSPGVAVFDIIPAVVPVDIELSFETPTSAPSGGSGVVGATQADGTVARIHSGQ